MPNIFNTQQSSSNKKKRKKKKERPGELPREYDDMDMHYQSFESTETAVDNTDYRGFSTSISGLHLDNNERVDCCSMACCGSLQGDRNRYIVTGITPPSCFRRFILHIIIPVWIFLLATYCAVSIQDKYLNEMLSTCLVLMLIIYWVTQCYKGSYKRKLVRKELLWSKHSLIIEGNFRMRHHDEDSTVESFDELRYTARQMEAPEYFMGQTLSDIHNAHGLLGLYPNDYPYGVSSIENDETNICRKFFRIFDFACCRLLCCGKHLQVCGICALAQEGRELERILHPGYRRLDYITMQPMIDYYPTIYESRNNAVEETTWWWGRLSQLPKEIIKTAIVCLVCLFLWSLVAEPVHHKFEPLDFGVFCICILQSLLVLKLVHFRHENDISLDALLKFAACGFCLSTTMAVFFELFVGLSLRLVMTIIFQLSGIDQMEQNAYYSLGHNDGFANVWANMDATGGPSSYRDYLHVYGREHPIVYTFYLLFNSFVLAAMVEELCKYFGFRMVEHPDFLSQKELQEAVKFTYHPPPNEKGSQEKDFVLQDRGAQSKGAAITIGMVAASVGFACCENLVYIFAYGEQTFQLELAILILRSLLPVHPVAAALQSIQVCKRDVESTKLGLLKLILPGLIFHGLYDFCLLWVDFMANRKGSYTVSGNGDDDIVEEAANASDWYSVFLGFFIVLGGYAYYRRQSQAQSMRLRRMDNPTLNTTEENESTRSGVIV